MDSVGADRQRDRLFKSVTTSLLIRKEFLINFLDHFSVKDLQPGVRYTFRVNAYSILGIAGVGEPIDYKIGGIY